VRGTPAWHDGLNYGDEILAVDGVQVTGARSLLQSLTRYRPGEQVEFLVSRYGEPRTIPVTLGTQSTPIYSLTEIANPTQAQLAVRLRWREGSP
jgi:predicted metalloprotease with PDZ domain